MFKKIKFLLFKKGYLKLDTIEKKIKFIITNIEKVNLYSSSYRNIYCDFLEKDILDYIEVLKIIVRSPLDTKIITVKSITESSYISTSFSYWYSNKGDMLDNKEYINTWLTLSLGFIEWCEEAKKNFNNTNSINNYRKLSPYYNNINNIIENMLEELKKT